MRPDDDAAALGAAPAHVVIRDERAGDHESVGALLRSAFASSAEAELVAALRASGDVVLSLVAERTAPDGERRVVGHVLFSIVTLMARDGAPICRGLGLAPLAVAPRVQRRGVGSMLVRAGLDACRARGHGFVVVLGDPAYYARFGFTRAALADVANDYGADAHFMLRELAPSALPPGGGLARYAAPFAALPA